MVRRILQEDKLKLAAGQLWCAINSTGDGNRAYFMITRRADGVGWMALALDLGVGWLPYIDGEEIVFSVLEEPSSDYLELVFDGSELA